MLDETRDDLTVRVFGPQLDILRAQAEEVRALLGATDGVVGERIDLPIEEPTVEVEVDLAAAQAAGVKPGDVRRAAATLLSGINVGSLFDDQKVFDVVVWGVPSLRQSVSDVVELPIETPTGELVTLGSFADIRVAPNPTVIRHDSVSRYMDVVANVEGRSIGAVEGEIKHAISGLAFPLEFHAEVLEADDGTSTAILIGIIIAAVVGAFLLLQACFGSWRHATLAFIAIPMCLAGGVLAVLADGATASLGTVIGFFAVGAITARQGMLLIRRCQQLEHGDTTHASANGERAGADGTNGHMAFGPDLVRRAARERATPIMLTTIAVGLATLPVLVRGGSAGHELLQPLAVVLLGGLVTGALVNLFIVPLLYLRMGPSQALSWIDVGPADATVAQVLAPVDAPAAGVEVLAPVDALPDGGNSHA